MSLPDYVNFSNKPLIVETNQQHSSNTEIIKGKLRLLGGKNEENLYCTITKDKRQLRCYKEQSSISVHKKFDLKGAKIDDQNQEPKNDLKLLLKSGKAVIFSPFEETQVTELKNFFKEEQQLNKTHKKSNSILKKFKNGFSYLAKAPSGTITILEKIGDKFRRTPAVLFGSISTKKKKDKKIPNGPAQGVYFGAESAVNEIAEALVGLVAEPMKGAKEKGFKGATSGLGKGIAGLIFKPVAGTIDLVTYTARGVGKFPRVIAKDVFRIRRKKQTSLERKEIEKDLELIYENDREEIYVDKKRLSIQGEILIEKQSLDPQENEKHSKERANKERLTLIMKNIINKIDADLQTNNFASDNIEVQDRKEDKEFEEDKEISEIIQLYQNEEDSQAEDNLYEFFFIKNNSQDSPEFSMQTDSFDDKPPENFFNPEFEEPENRLEDLDLDSSVSFESYNLELAVNKPIPIDDSDEFDVDEFQEDDMRIAKFLSLHTGRDGRNGPISQALQEDGLYPSHIIFENILDNELRDASRENEMDKSNLFMNNSVKKSHSNIYLKLDQMGLNSLKKLIPEVVDRRILINWKYPEIKVDLPYKEIEDLPDTLSLRDYEIEKKFCKLKGNQLISFLENWHFVENQDDERHFLAHKKGGKLPEREIIVKKIRTVGKEFLMKIGRSVLSGNFNLTTVPFPIKGSIPKSYFENIGATPTCYYPLYLNLAMKNQDPLQRFKFYLVSSIAYYYLTSPYAKPFNPILGETFTGYYEDGSEVYCEQISHHPQVSYLLYYGPKKAYKVWGPSNFAAHTSLNSLNIITKGWRKIEFSDTKQVISNTFPNEHYEGVLWGGAVTETIGNMEFNDVENEISCKLIFGSVKKRPSDYFEGIIYAKGKKVSHVFGTYLGWIEIDKVRYFDYRYCHPFEFQHEKSPLFSDFRYRIDYLHLKQGYVEIAQKEKDTLERIQRNDAKLRKEYSKDKKR